MDRFEKQPYEEYTISTDFSQNMVAGETIASQTVTCTDKNGTDVSATVTTQGTVTNDGSTRVAVLVKAGSASASPYKLTFRIVTSISHKWEHDIQMRVVEI